MKSILSKMRIEWFEAAQLKKYVKRQIQPVDIALDIGCGIRPQQLVRPKIHICVDPFRKYLDYVNSHHAEIRKGTYVLINASWQEIFKLFPSKSIDSIFLIDVIKHIEKKEVKLLLKKSELIAKKQIIVFTPLGFIPQGKIDAWGLKGGKFQEHKSGWLPKHFDKSWKIIGSKKYHFKDYKGKKLPESYGAFWAIKNLQSNNQKDAKFRKGFRETTHIMVDEVFNLGEKIYSYLR